MLQVSAVIAASTIGDSAGIALGAVGAVVAVPAAYLLTLSLAALRHRPRGAAAAPRTRVVVVVPAHDEAALIGRCVRSLLAQAYPRDQYAVVVVADNCSDATAAVAAAAGARVLVRDDAESRGKGRALRWAFDRLLADSPAPDAIAVVDADAIVDPGFLAVAVAALERGAPAVQADNRLAGDAGTGTALRVAAFLLFNRVRPAGRAVLGLPCHLTGSGMLLAHDVLVDVPWAAFTSAEDLEYTLELRVAGIGVTYAGGAGVVSPAAPNDGAALAQRLRWEGGRTHLARTRVPRLLSAALRERRPALLDAALDLAVPPLTVLAATVLAGAAAALGFAVAGAPAAWTLLPWVAALVFVTLYVLVGFRAAHAPGAMYRALAIAPIFVLRRLRHSREVVRFDTESWVRTERAGEAMTTRPPRSDT